MISKGALKAPRPKMVVTNFSCRHFSANLVSNFASQMFAVGTVLVYPAFRKESVPLKFY